MWRAIALHCFRRVNRSLDGPLLRWPSSIAIDTICKSRDANKNEHTFFFYAWNWTTFWWKNCCRYTRRSRHHISLTACTHLQHDNSINYLSAEKRTRARRLDTSLDCRHLKPVFVWENFLCAVSVCSVTANNIEFAHRLTDHMSHRKMWDTLTYLAVEHCYRNRPCQWQWQTRWLLLTYRFVIHSRSCNSEFPCGINLTIDLHVIFCRYQTPKSSIKWMRLRCSCNSHGSRLKAHASWK